MPNQQPIRKGSALKRNAHTTAASIPDKLYFRIGEVAELCGVEPYVLRFWESEFPQLKPNKSGTGQRLYRRRDVETALNIKRLLYDEGYTIPGARQAFKTETRSKSAQPDLPFASEPQPATGAGKAKLQSMRKELRAILDVLSSRATERTRT